MDPPPRFEAVPIGRLSPHPRNPRRGDPAAIARSLGEFGQVPPLLAQRSTGHVLKGNHTLLAARAAGLKTLRVEWRDCDDEAALRIVLSDNRASEAGGYDRRQLADAVSAADGDGLLAATGYGPDDLAALLGGVSPAPEPEPPPPPAPPAEVAVGASKLAVDFDPGAWLDGLAAEAEAADVKPGRMLALRLLKGVAV